MENCESSDAGDKSREVELKGTCNFSHHVIKLHSAKTVAICEMSSKLNRASDKVDDAQLPNGNGLALKRHDENGGLPHLDQKNTSSKTTMSKESAHDASSSSSDSISVNEAAAQKPEHDAQVQVLSVGPESSAGQNVIHSSVDGDSSHISPTDITDPCKITTLEVASAVGSGKATSEKSLEASCDAGRFELSKKFPEKELERPAKDEKSNMGGNESSTRKKADPFAGGSDSHIIMSLAAAARSACLSSIESEQSEEDNQELYDPNAQLQVGGIKFSLIDLKTFVGDRGGFQVVNDSKLWTTVARDMGIDVTKYTSAASNLKRVYQYRFLAEPVARSQLSSSAVDRSALAARLLAKCKANEASTSGSSVELQAIKKENKEEDRSVACANPFNLGDSTENKNTREADGLSEKKSVHSDVDKVEMDIDELQGSKIDEDCKSSGVKLKKESDLKEKSLMDIAKMETDSRKGLFASRDDSRSSRDNSGCRTASNVSRDGELARRKSRRDADGSGQMDDMPEKKLSREDRKFRSILRQIELLEKKQKGPDSAPATSSGDASPRRQSSWESEIELASLTKRRKDLLKEELREKERDRERTQDRERKEKEKERKDREQEMISSGKKRPASQSRECNTPQPMDLNMSASKKPKGPSKQTPAKVVNKIPGRRSSKFCDERLQGPLVVLREYRKATRKTFPCLPRVLSKSTDNPEKRTMCSKKAHVLTSVASECDDGRSSSVGCRTRGALWESELPVDLDPFRLNPHRRPQDKKIFPVMKRLLQQWTSERISSGAEDSVCDSPQQPIVGGEKLSSDGRDVPDNVDMDQECEMDLDRPESASPSASPVVESGEDKLAESVQSRQAVEPEVVPEKVLPSREVPEGSKVKDLRTTLSNESRAREGDMGHRNLTEIAHLTSQNRRPICLDHGASLTTGKSRVANEPRSSPPLSPVSSTGIPSRNGSPVDRGGLTSSSRTVEASASHRRPSSHETPVASPRHRHNAWDLTPSGDRGSHESREARESREGRESRERRDRDRDRDREVRNTSRESGPSHSSCRDTSLLRDRPRESSPVGQSLRRRLVSPPRALFTGELRERGLQLSEGGLSRESLRRERQGLSAPSNGRTNERVGLASAGGLGRDRDRLAAGADHISRQTERSGSKHWGTELARALSPGRSQDRGERGLVISERLGLERAGGQERGGLGSGNSISRERSLSPRSKEALREMQVARERRAKEMPADAAEPGEMESPGRWSGAARPADPWWASTSPSSARSGLASPGGLRTGAGGRAEAGLRIGGGGSGGARRERPSMFDHRRGR